MTRRRSRLQSQRQIRGSRSTTTLYKHRGSYPRVPPYFLQEWGKHAWDAAAGSPITRPDVDVASRTAVAALDESFFRVRLDRLTAMEKKYLRAMAHLGPGPHRSGDIAEQLNPKVTSLGLTRNALIAKGMIWIPSHGGRGVYGAFVLRVHAPNHARRRLAEMVDPTASQRLPPCTSASPTPSPTALPA